MDIKKNAGYFKSQIFIQKMGFFWIRFISIIRIHISISVSYYCCPTKITSSTSLFEYPYSLSYHATTLTKLPSTTWVNDKSTMADAASPTISVKTNGSFDTSKYPL